MKKEFWFIRHGQSMTNAGLSWPNPFTNPLTELGHQQAKTVSGLLVHKPTLIVTSPYIRTLETARPTLDRWSDVAHEVWPVQEFTHWSFEKYGSAGMDVIRERNRSYWDDFDPDFKEGDDAESFHELLIRVDQSIEQIKGVSDEKVIMFSHGYFLATLFCRLENMELDKLSIDDVRAYRKRVSLPNTALAHFSFCDEEGAQMHSLVTDHVLEQD